MPIKRTKNQLADVYGESWQLMNFILDNDHTNIKQVTDKVLEVSVYSQQGIDTYMVLLHVNDPVHDTPKAVDTKIDFINKQHSESPNILHLFDIQSYFKTIPSNKYSHYWETLGELAKYAIKLNKLEQKLLMKVPVESKRKTSENTDRKTFKVLQYLNRSQGTIDTYAMHQAVMLTGISWEEKNKIKELENRDVPLAKASKTIYEPELISSFNQPGKIYTRRGKVIFDTPVIGPIMPILNELESLRPNPIQKIPRKPPILHTMNSRLTSFLFE